MINEIILYSGLMIGFTISVVTAIYVSNNIQKWIDEIVEVI